jgi:hypothetical protein
MAAAVALRTTRDKGLMRSAAASRCYVLIATSSNEVLWSAEIKSSLVPMLFCRR